MRQELRAQVLERDNYTCQRCRCLDKKLEARHTLARRFGGTDDLDNMTALCCKCQWIIEPARNRSPATNPDYAYHYQFKFDPDIIRALRILALEGNTTATALLEEAVIMLLKARKKL